MPDRLSKIPLVLLALLAVAPLAAQPMPDPAPPVHRFWGGFALGTSAAGSGFAAYGTYVTGNHVLSVRSAGEADMIAPAAFVYGDALRFGVADVAVLYGRRLLERDRGFLSAGVGLSGVVDLKDSGTVVFGLPVEVQASVQPSRALGFAAYGFANLNPHQSFAGVGIGMQLGRIR